MIKKITASRILSKSQAANLKTKFLDHTHYNQLITTDCDAYDNYGNLLFRFRKNAIPINILKTGVDAFKHSIEVTESRGAWAAAFNHIFSVIHYKAYSQRW